MKHTKYQSGFGAIEITLVGVLVGVMGFVGWQWYKANHQPASNTVVYHSTSNNSTNTTPPADPYKGWQTYSKYGISFKYPAGWEIQQDKSSHEVNGKPDILSVVLISKYSPKNHDLCSPTTGGKLYLSVSYGNIKLPDITGILDGSVETDYQGQYSAVSETKLGGQQAVQANITPPDCGHRLATLANRNGYGYDVSTAGGDKYIVDYYKTEYNKLAASFKFTD